MTGLSRRLRTLLVLAACAWLYWLAFYACMATDCYLDFPRWSVLLKAILPVALCLHIFATVLAIGAPGSGRFRALTALAHAVPLAACMLILWLLQTVPI